jgi:hypothetical protein
MKFGHFIYSGIKIIIQFFSSICADVIQELSQLNLLLTDFEVENDMCHTEKGVRLGDVVKEVQQFAFVARTMDDPGNLYLNHGVAKVQYVD